jgi:hypothetical protein
MVSKRKNTRNDNECISGFKLNCLGAGSIACFHIVDWDSYSTPGFKIETARAQSVMSTESGASKSK